MKNKETLLLLVLSSWNNKKQTDEKQGFAPLLTVNKRNIEMKNKETPFCEPAQRTDVYVTGEQKGFDAVIRSIVRLF